MSLLTLNILSTIPVAAASESQSSYTKTYNKLKRINNNISHELYSKQVTDKKAHLDPNFAWTKFIKSIKYLKNNQVEVYVNDNFTKLKENARMNVIDNAQMFSLRIIDDIKSPSEETYIKGLATIIFCDGNYIGRSKFMSHKDFIWNR